MTSGSWPDLGPAYDVAAARDDSPTAEPFAALGLDERRAPAAQLLCQAPPMAANHLLVTGVCEPARSIPPARLSRQLFAR